MPQAACPSSARDPPADLPWYYTSSRSTRGGLSYWHDFQAVLASAKPHRRSLGCPIPISRHYAL